LINIVHGTRTGVKVTCKAGEGLEKTADYIRSCVADGTSYEVKMKWSSGSKFVQFTVPAGKNIFEQTQNQNIPINSISTNDGTITFANGNGKFCHACVTGGVNRPGDTCWALTPNSDNHRQCGCNSQSWAGEGIYYGGKKKHNKCHPQGGGFAGPKLHGHKKGNLGSLGLKVLVRCNKDDGWTTMLSEEAGTGNGNSFDNSPIRHLDISGVERRRRRRLLAFEKFKSKKRYSRGRRRLVDALCEAKENPTIFEYLFKKGNYGSLNIGKEEFDKKSKESTCSKNGVGVILKRECSSCGNQHKLIFYKRVKEFSSTSMLPVGYRTSTCC
jgi:hypothetical protein